MSTERKSLSKVKKLSMLAHVHIDKCGIEPIDELVEALAFAKNMTKSGGNVDQTGKTDQAQFLALWMKAAYDLARFKYPILSAIAVKDMNNDKEKTKPITMLDAINIIKADPFAPKEIKEISAEQVVEAMTDNIQNIHLPSGAKKVSSSEGANK